VGVSKVVLGVEKRYSEHFDLNSDGVINSVDIAIVRSLILGVNKADVPKENKLYFRQNPKFTEFLKSTDREATVAETDQGQRILVYNNSGNSSGNNIPYMKMTVPDGWKVTYSTEIESPLPKTVTSGSVLENAFIYYVLVEETNDVVYTDDEILSWYLSMEIGDDIVLPYFEGEISDEIKIAVWTQFEKEFPNTDFSDFKLVYSETSNFQGSSMSFDVYYKDLLIYGNPHTTVAGDGKVVIGHNDGTNEDFVYIPREYIIDRCLELDVTEKITEEQARQIVLDKHSLPQDYEGVSLNLVIYNSDWGELDLAYQINGVTQGDGEVIMNAVTGEIMDIFEDVVAPTEYPLIVDEQGEIPGEVKTAIWDKFASEFPDTDFSDFKLVNNPRGSTESYPYYFDIYYKNLQLVNNYNFGSGSGIRVVILDGNTVVMYFDQEYINQVKDIEVLPTLTPDQIREQLADYEFADSSWGLEGISLDYTENSEFALMIYTKPSAEEYIYDEDGYYDGIRKIHYEPKLTYRIPVYVGGMVWCEVFVDAHTAEVLTQCTHVIYD
jgi:hypothetical protein